MVFHKHGEFDLMATRLERRMTFGKLWFTKNGYIDLRIVKSGFKKRFVSIAISFAFALIFPMFSYDSNIVDILYYVLSIVLSLTIIFKYFRFQQVDR